MLTVSEVYPPVISNLETSAGWRAEVVGRRIRAQRERLGWTQDYLAYVITDMGVHTTKVDVSRRERGVRQLTVDQLFTYAIALGCGIADLLIEEDPDHGEIAWITPLHGSALDAVAESRRRRRRAPKFREPARAYALRLDELREWLANGNLWG